MKRACKFCERESENHKQFEVNGEWFCNDDHFKQYHDIVRKNHDRIQPNVSEFDLRHFFSPEFLSTEVRGEYIDMSDADRSAAIRRTEEMLAAFKERLQIMINIDQKKQKTNAVSKQVGSIDRTPTIVKKQAARQLSDFQKSVVSYRKQVKTLPVAAQVKYIQECLEIHGGINMSAEQIKAEIERIDAIQ